MQHHPVTRRQTASASSTQHASSLVIFNGCKVRQTQQRSTARYGLDWQAYSGTLACSLPAYLVGGLAFPGNMRGTQRPLQVIEHALEQQLMHVRTMPPPDVLHTRLSLDQRWAGAIRLNGPPAEPWQGANTSHLAPIPVTPAGRSMLCCCCKHS